MRVGSKRSVEPGFGVSRPPTYSVSWEWLRCTVQDRSPLLGLVLVSLLVGVFYVGATLPPSERPRPVEEAAPKQEPPEVGPPCSEIPRCCMRSSPLVSKSFARSRAGSRSESLFGTIVLPYDSRDGLTVAEGRVVCATSDAVRRGSVRR